LVINDFIFLIGQYIISYFGGIRVQIPPVCNVDYVNMQEQILPVCI